MNYYRRSTPDKILNVRPRTKTTSSRKGSAMPSPHPTLTYAVADEWAEPSSGSIMDGLLAYNATFYGTPKEKKLAITAPAEDGRLVAGLLGQTHHGWLYVGWLWVSEELRNRRIGTELMRR